MPVPVRTDIGRLMSLKKELLQGKCREAGVPAGGTKHDLALRLVGVGQAPNKPTRSGKEITTELPPQQITVPGFVKLHSKRTFVKDLRQAPPINFSQVYRYLVLRASKYSSGKLSGTEYKVLKAFKFYREGKVRKICISTDGSPHLIQASVEASMKVNTNYKCFLEVEKNGDVLRGACTCPAGLGVNGMVKCNHAAALLFAIEDCVSKEVSKAPNVVSCTSQLSKWVVPRTLQKKANIDEMTFCKIKYGKETKKAAQATNQYDPRAPMQRNQGDKQFCEMATNLGREFPQSGALLFKKSTSTKFHAGLAQMVEVDSICMDIPEDSPDIPEHEVSMPFSDSYDIETDLFQEMVVAYTKNKPALSYDEVMNIEARTKEQANSKEWHTLRKDKITASNFGVITRRKKDPTKLLNQMMYAPLKPTQAMQYGTQHEQIARDLYCGATGFVVFSAGLILATDRPDYGASLDGIVMDTDSTPARGGLEIKCPLSKEGMHFSEAAKEKAFFLETKDDGTVHLKQSHKYYVQVQGQMYCAKLEWVDFVVFFGKDLPLFISRVHFDASKWDTVYLPALDHFYTSAFVPELLTRRIRRNVPLFPKGTWKPKA